MEPTPSQLESMAELANVITRAGLLVQVASAGRVCRILAGTELFLKEQRRDQQEQLENQEAKLDARLAAAMQLADRASAICAAAPVHSRHTKPAIQT